MDKTIKHKKIINFIRAQNLGWLGHIERMQETRMVKAIYSWKPFSRRPIGRPKIRWEDDVRKDTQKLKVPNRPLSKIEEVGRNWLRRTKHCIKSFRTIIYIYIIYGNYPAESYIFTDYARRTV